MTLIVKFHIEDETFSIEKIVMDMQVYDCFIKVPILITNHYGFSLVISKTSECFSEGEKKKKSTAGFSFFAVDGARLKVMLMKRIITIILNSNQKIQVNLLGFLYGT
ncbi:hypothetical protein ACB094_04G161300 [Castanea mollissima]